MALLLIIEVKINFSLGFDNTDYQTNKLYNAVARSSENYHVILNDSNHNGAIFDLH